MTKVEIFDPALCCPTGVCGPSVDPELTRMASAVFLLEKKGLTLNDIIWQMNLLCLRTIKKSARFFMKRGQKPCRSRWWTDQLPRRADTPLTKNCLNGSEWMLTHWLRKSPALNSRST